MQAPAELNKATIDPGRLQEIYERHHGLVFRAACRVTGNAEDAEDVLQTVFLRLLRRPESLGSVNELESYLYRAAVNAALDLMRSRQRGQPIPLDEAAPRVVSDSSQKPDRTVASDEIREWLRRAVAGLSDLAGEAFVLRFFEGKKNPEIAEILGTTTSTIAVTLHRARERLEREYRVEFGGVS